MFSSKHKDLKLHQLEGSLWKDKCLSPAARKKAILKRLSQRRRISGSTTNSSRLDSSCNSPQQGYQTNRYILDRETKVRDFTQLRRTK